MLEALAQQAIDRVVKEAAVIKQAPVAVTTLVGLTIVGTSLVVWWIASALYQERIARQQANIGVLQATIDLQSRRTEQKPDRGQLATVTTQSIPPQAPSLPSRWMVIASGQIGVNTKQDVPQVIEFISTVQSVRNIQGRDGRLLIGWASAFAEWSLQKAGQKGPGNPDPLAWLKWGQPTKDFEFGCIVVVQLAAGPHVGFFLERDGENLRILSGFNPVPSAENDLTLRGVGRRLVFAKSALAPCRMPT